MVTRNRCWHCGVWHDGAMEYSTKRKGGVCNCDCEDCNPKKSR
jgi:hypothetical protein